MEKTLSRKGFMVQALEPIYSIDCAKNVLGRSTIGTFTDLEDTSGLYYKHLTIVNDNSSIISK